MSNQPCICPQCQNMDRVQKVSSIYHAGTMITPHYATVMAGNTPVPMVSNRVGYTSLSSMLRPPVPPRRVFALKTMLLTTIPMLVGYAALIIGLNIGGTNSYILTFFVVLAATTIGFLFIQRIRARWWNDLMRDIQPKRQIWDRLFCCYRCDLVFNPDSRQSVPPARIEELYQSVSASTGYFTNVDETS